MKISLRNIVSRYFDSWWIPTVVALIMLAAFTITAWFPWMPMIFVPSVLAIAFGVAILGLIAASVWNFVRKRWAKGIANLLMLPVCGVAVVFAFGFLMIASLFGPSEDGFANDLIIPDNIEISEPLNWNKQTQDGHEDAFQASLLAALGTAGSDDTSITATLSCLVQLYESAPDILRRYLITSPAWRVFKERGAIFATRRWMIGSEWRYDLHGYYSYLDLWSHANLPRFQTRFTIGLSGKPWWRGSRNSTRMYQGQTKRVTLSLGNQMYESHCVIDARGLVVEIFEQSNFRERRITKAALAYLEKELRPLLEDPRWATIRKILPPGSVKYGEPLLELRQSFQPGIYDSVVWANPGEPGMIYLKAFEVTHGTRLSVYTLEEESNEWIGWSDNASDLFFSNTHFIIYEGDWGKPYAARFEVWFVPDLGGPERKLMERVFKIEGWQR